MADATVASALAAASMRWPAFAKNSASEKGGGPCGLRSRLPFGERLRERERERSFFLDFLAFLSFLPFLPSSLSFFSPLKLRSPSSRSSLRPLMPAASFGLISGDEEFALRFALDYSLIEAAGLYQFQAAPQLPEFRGVERVLRTNSSGGLGVAVQRLLHEFCGVRGRTAHLGRAM